jgi:hypothetical protein
VVDIDNNRQERDTSAQFINPKSAPKLVLTSYSSSSSSSSLSSSLSCVDVVVDDDDDVGSLDSQNSDTSSMCLECAPFCCNNIPQTPPAAL